MSQKTSPETDFVEIGFTAGSDEHDTPARLFEPLAKAVGGFDLDPCASASSDLADVNFTAEEDGLSYDWWGTVYFNPPYSDVGGWMEYAAEQHAAGNTDLIVGLVYARTSTQWFHRHATTADLWGFIEGRVQFVGSDNSAPAPSLVPVWGDYPDALIDAIEYQPERVANRRIETGGFAVEL